MTFQPAHKDTEHPAGQIRYPRTLNEVIKKIEQEEGLEPHRIVQGVSKLPSPTLDPEMRLQRLVGAFLSACRQAGDPGTLSVKEIQSILEVYAK